MRFQVRNMDKKRIVGFVLAAALCVGSLSPLQVQAAETIESAKKKSEQLEKEKAQAEKNSHH